MEKQTAGALGSKQVLKSFLLFIFFGQLIFIKLGCGEKINWTNLKLALSFECSLYVLWLVSTILLSAFFLGKPAGREIILSNRSFWLVGLKYGLITLLAIGIYLCIWLYSAGLGPAVKEILPFVLVRVAAPVILFWIWPCWRMKVRTARLLIA